MKYLVYTISDLKDSSVRCVDLLYQSLMHKNEGLFELVVIANKQNHNLNKPYQIIFDELNSPYIGWLKYSKKIPAGYDYYFYFDSDILCYELLDNLKGTHQFSLVPENYLMSTSWFAYPFANFTEQFIFNTIRGINAGTYVFTDLRFIETVRAAYENVDLNLASIDHRQQAMFEQTCFNYAVHQMVAANQYNDISGLLKLFAEEDVSDKTIYHFCGYEGTMDNKYALMNAFNNKYLECNGSITILETRNDLLDLLPQGLVWAELGVFIGDFSKEIYTQCKPRTLYLVDLFPPQMISGDKNGNNVVCANITSVPDTLKEYFKDANVIIVKSDTTEFLKSQKHHSFDVIYVDADHSYEAVKSDLNLSFDLVKEDGFICGHDYTEAMFPGVVQAVNEFCQARNLKITYLTKDGCPTYCIKKSCS